MTVVERPRAINASLLSGRLHRKGKRRSSKFEVRTRPGAFSDDSEVWRQETSRHQCGAGQSKTRNTRYRRFCVPTRDERTGVVSKIGTFLKESVNEQESKWRPIHIFSNTVTLLRNEPPQYTYLSNRRKGPSTYLSNHRDLPARSTGGVRRQRVSK